MRKIIVFLFFSSTLISCCETQHQDVNIKMEELEYPNNFISWVDVFSQTEDSYFVYVFSYDCYYCKQIKNKIITFCHNSDFPVYLVEYVKEIPVKNKISETIGMTRVDDLFIKGTPTLIFIYNQIVNINAAGIGEVSEIIELFSKK